MLGAGTTKQASTIKQGDVVLTGNGSTAVVRCVLKARCPGGVTPMVTLPSGAALTPYHPVRVARTGAWAFPADLAQTALQPAEFVYNYLLASGHSVLIDGTECVTVGHGVDADVVRHAFFGSNAAVVRDLERLPGWNVGLVELEPASFLRKGGASGEVCGIVHAVASDAVRKGVAPTAPTNILASTVAVHLSI
jgi:hypothetical protein